MSARDLKALQRQQESAGRRRRKVPPIVIAGAVAFCLAAAAGAIWFAGSLRRQAAGDAGSPASTRGLAPAPVQPAKPGPIYPFEPFIVNVAGTDGTRYLKATISVECADRKASADIAGAQVKVRDAIIDALSAYTLEDLTDVSKRDAIRRRVASAIEGAVPGGKKGLPRVKGVYFVEFVIQ